MLRRLLAASAVIGATTVLALSVAAPANAAAADIPGPLCQATGGSVVDAGDGFHICQGGPFDGEPIVQG